MRPPNDYSRLYWIKLVQWYQREDLWGQYQSNAYFVGKTHHVSPKSVTYTCLSY